MGDLPLNGTEVRFSRLVSTCRTSESVRDMLLELRDFLNHLDRSGLLKEPYLLRLESVFPKRFDPSQVFGTDPMDIWPLHAQLQPETVLTEIRDHVRQYLLLLFACVGEVSGMVALYDAGRPDPDFMPVRGNAATASRPDSDPRQLITTFRQDSHLPSSAQKDSDVICRYLIWVERNRDNSVCIPVVENDRYGRLRHIRLKSGFIHSEAMDLVSTDVALASSDVDTSALTEHPLRVARMTATRVHPPVKDLRFHFKLGFEYAQILHEGRSGELGLTLLLLGGLLESASSPNRYWPRQGATFTGCLTDDGDVLPVSADSLRIKLRSVFFSPARSIAVPIEQVALAKEEVRFWQERYPNRLVEVVPVSTLEDAISDRRLTRQWVDHPISRAARRIRQRWTIATVLILSAAFVWAAGSLIQEPPHPNPVSYTVENGYMRLFNQDKVEVHRLPVSPFVEERHLNDEFYRLFELSDINRDGINDVLISTADNFNSDEHGWLEAHDVHNGRLLWKYLPDVDLVFPHKPGAGEAYYITNMQVTGDTLVVVLTDREFFASPIVMLDRQTGRRIGDPYLHIGGVTSLELIDMDQDGQVEIVAAAQANALGSNSLFALKLDRLSGHSPSTPDYEAVGVSRAQELHYLHFPQTIVGTGRNPGIPRPITTRIAHLPSTNQLRVNVIDLQLDQIENRIRTNVTADLYYFIELPSFVIRRYGTVDSYDRLARDFHDRGFLERYPDNAYFQDFLRYEVRYLTSSGWLGREEYVRWQTTN